MTVITVKPSQSAVYPGFCCDSCWTLVTVALGSVTVVVTVRPCRTALKKQRRMTAVTVVTVIPPFYWRPTQ